MSLEDVLKALKKLLKRAEKDIGISAALQDEAMHENAVWRVEVYQTVIRLLEEKKT